MATNTISKAQLWTGRIMSGVVILFLLMDAIMKFVKPPEVVEITVNDLGYQEHHIATMGALLLISTLLYLIPRTSILGAILVTAYLGGAIATNFRLDKPLFSHELFPVYLAILMWGGLWLREPRLKDLIPLKKG